MSSRRPRRVRDAAKFGYLAEFRPDRFGVLLVASSTCVVPANLVFSEEEMMRRLAVYSFRETMDLDIKREGEAQHHIDAEYQRLLSLGLIT